MHHQQHLRTIRRALLWLLTIGLAGTAAELLLLGHTEDAWQLIPLILIGLALTALLAYGVTGKPGSLLALRGVMALSMASGVAGSILHYRGNAEFEQESLPGIAGFDLFRESLSGATPTLAPGTMILLGALGWLYTWRHPVFTDSSNPHEA